MTLLLPILILTLTPILMILTLTKYTLLIACRLGFCSLSCWLVLLFLGIDVVLIRTFASIQLDWIKYKIISVLGYR